MCAGASRGIGQAFAEHLAAIGMKVVLTARSVDDLSKIEAGIKAKGGEAAHIRLDVKSVADTKAAFDFAEQTFGPVYLVCANSGTADVLTELPDVSEDEIDHILAVNQKAPLIAMQHAHSHFVKNGGGVWVATSSIASSIHREMYTMMPVGALPHLDLGSSLLPIIARRLWCHG